MDVEISSFLCVYICNHTTATAQESEDKEEEEGTDGQTKSEGGTRTLDYTPRQGTGCYTILVAEGEHQQCLGGDHRHTHPDDHKPI